MLTSKDHVIGIGLIIILISCFVWTLFLKNKNKEEFDKNTSFYRYICEERGDLFGPFAGGYINKEGTRYDSLNRTPRRMTGRVLVGAQIDPLF